MVSYTIRNKRNREKFLDNLRKGYSPSKAAKNTGPTVQSFLKWREDDDDFREEWEAAVEEGTDGLEDVATRRAKAGSDTLLMFMLKARRPNKYRDNAPPSPSTIKVVLSKDDMDL